MERDATRRYKNLAPNGPPPVGPVARRRAEPERDNYIVFTEAEKDRIIRVLDAYCERRVPLHVRDKLALQFRIKGQDVILFEKRPHFRRQGEWTESGVAKFKFNRPKGTWTLLWRDRNSKWHYYDPCPPSQRFEDLLEEVDRDSTAIFWGYHLNKPCTRPEGAIR